MQVMYVPQRPVAAPGPSLLEQLIYPSCLSDHSAVSDMQRAAGLLHDVGLEDLLYRVDGDWRRKQDWQGDQPVRELPLLPKMCSSAVHRCTDRQGVAGGCSQSRVCSTAAFGEHCILVMSGSENVTKQVLLAS